MPVGPHLPLVALRALAMQASKGSDPMGPARGGGGADGHHLTRRIKGDERILGDSEFVLSILQEAGEQYERGYDLNLAPNSL